MPVLLHLAQNGGGITAMRRAGYTALIGAVATLMLTWGECVPTYATYLSQEHQAERVRMRRWGWGPSPSLAPLYGKEHSRCVYVFPAVISIAVCLVLGVLALVGVFGCPCDCSEAVKGGWRPRQSLLTAALYGLWLTTNITQCWLTGLNHRDIRLIHAWMILLCCEAPIKFMIMRHESLHWWSIALQAPFMIKHWLCCPPCHDDNASSSTRF